MRISDWSSDVCSSDLTSVLWPPRNTVPASKATSRKARLKRDSLQVATDLQSSKMAGSSSRPFSPTRSEEHTSELQSLMRISYAVFCLKKKNRTTLTPPSRLCDLPA